MKRRKRRSRHTHHPHICHQARVSSPILLHTSTTPESRPAVHPSIDIVMHPAKHFQGTSRQNNHCLVNVICRMYAVPPIFNEAVGRRKLQGEEPGPEKIYGHGRSIYMMAIGDCESIVGSHRRWSTILMHTSQA